MSLNECDKRHMDNCKETSVIMNISAHKEFDKRTFSKTATALQVLEGVDLTGKVFLITGGSSGIGFETAKALVFHNAHVVIACRNVVKAVTAIENIKNEKDDAKVSFIALDNCDLQSVEDCATKFKATYKSLHCLILNAGVYNPLHRITDNEFEATFQINYLSHFYLTTLLLPVLQSSAPSRVVVVSAEAHRGIGGMNLTPDKITWEHLSPTHKHSFNSAAYAFGLSKLCALLFSNELNKRYSSMGIISNAVHPGIVNTHISQNSPALHLLMKATAPFLKRPEQGAATIVYSATAPEIDNLGGQYLSNCRIIPTSAPARNSENAELVWKMSELMLKTYLLQRERTLKHVLASSNQATVQ